MEWKERVRELRRIPAAELRANQHNWRLHPDYQRSGLQTAMQRIGNISAVVAREMPDGGLEIIDGHLRAEMAEDAVVPVLVVDLDDREMKEALATFDPIASMADTNPNALQLLLDELSGSGHDEFEALLQDVADMSGMVARMLEVEQVDASFSPHMVESEDGSSVNVVTFPLDIPSEEYDRFDSLVEKLSGSSIRREKAEFVAGLVWKLENRHDGD